MYHPQSLFLLALSILVFPSEPSQTQSYTKNKFLDCATTSIHCQDRDWNISYPFRRPSMPPYCGHPMFDVECININSDSILSINISGNHYRVSDINYDKQFIGVSNLDYINDTCPHALYNTTIDIYLFKYSVNDLNITMFLNCTPLALPSASLNISCPSSEPSANKSYYQVEGYGSPLPLDLFGNCNSVVVIPMYKDAASILVGGRMDLLGVLQDGFGLNWVVDNGWCNDCEESGGICGNDPDSPNGWACFCSDGSATSGTCPVIGCSKLNSEFLSAAHGANCVSSQHALFECVLSFSEADGGLSLLPAGFSHELELQNDCFKCPSCGINNHPVDTEICRCQSSCKRKSHKGIKYVIIGSIVGAFLFVCLSLALFFCQYTETSTSIICIGNNLTNNQNLQAFLKEYGSVAPKRYTYSEVKKITNAFKEKLGQGGYGTVFKGILCDRQVVAVKILRDSKGDGEEFINEVASISRTSHVNIVSLLGFCIEGSRRALIYDFMCNGSLEKLLSEKPKTNLEWEKLYQIAIGIARGLEYLHRGCNTRIVHFDIKPHNILLDEDFRPKISDFGLAKLCLQKESIISISGMRGTAGYIAPEIFSRNFGVVSSKSDVYSYGMMVLEMAEGRENPNSRAENNSDIYFPHWIYEHLDKKGGLLACGVTAESEETVRKMILVGLWCIQTMPQNRPSMSQVIEMLEGSTDDLHVPPKPYLSSSPFGSLLGNTSIQDTCGIASSIQSIVVTS